MEAPCSGGTCSTMWHLCKHSKQAHHSLRPFDHCSVCTGNYDNCFVEMMEMRKGVIMDRTGDF